MTTTASTTPLPEALTAVDQAQAKGPAMQAHDPGPGRAELAALRDLAEAVRSHLATAGTVYVLRYAHRHGHDVYAYTTADGAANGLAAIVRSQWGDMIGRGEADSLPPTPDGLTDDEAVAMYFFQQEDEFAEITSCAIDFTPR